MTAIEYLPVCISACHFVRLNRCICLLTVGAHCALFFAQTLGGPLAVELRLCVNQAALQTASQAPPSCGVLFLSCLILSCQILFISSSVAPAIPQSSSSLSLRETVLTLKTLL